jgi:hypothetical protein
MAPFPSSKSGPHSHGTGVTSWKLSTIILILILLLFIFYFLLIFHYVLLPFAIPLSLIPSSLSPSPGSDKDITASITERDFIIKNLRGEIFYRQNKTNELEEDIGDLRQDYELKLHLEHEKRMKLEEEIKLLQQQIELQQHNHLNHSPSLSSSSSSSSAAFTFQDNRTIPGVIILGMHRSGTSIVGGLMNKMGLSTGGPLIQPNFDNEKGFFERIDVVLQNDEIMRKQNTYYSYRTAYYDSLLGIKSILTETGKFFNEGKRALLFLNNPMNFPWMLKDPRLCITLRTWLPFLSSIPSILFTYRNPMDVALSMNTRETEHFPISRGLKLWYIYNKRAIQQSHDLCRVVTSHKKMMSQPQIELKRIFYELKEKCHVPVPKEVSIEDIHDFIDIKLQHGRTSLLDSYCANPLTTDFESLHPPEEKWKTDDPKHLQLYRSCVKLYCDLESYSAYENGYQFDETITDE